VVLVSLSSWDLISCPPKLEPEIQLSFNNTTLAQNFLSISISGAEAKAIEAEAGPIR
jgi:hypothetical protein